MKKYNTKTFARALITTLCFLTMRPMEGYAAVSAAASIEQNSPLLKMPDALIVYTLAYLEPEDLQKVAQTSKALQWNSALASAPLYAAALRENLAIPKDIMFVWRSVVDTNQQAWLKGLILQNLFPKANPILSLNRTMPAFLLDDVEQVEVTDNVIEAFATENKMNPITVKWALRTYDSHWTRKGEAQPCVFEDIKGYVTLADARGMNPDILQGKTHLLVSHTWVNDNRNIIESIFQDDSDLTVVVDFGVATSVDKFFMQDSRVKHLRLSGKNLQSVGDYFLLGCTSLTTLTLPATLQSVGDDFLSGCSRLKTLTLPATLQSVGGDFLPNCISLTTLTLPGNLQSVGDYFLLGCTSLTTLTLPPDLQCVGDGFLNHCSSLTTLTLPGNLQTVGDYFLLGCTSLTTLTLPADLQCVGDRFLWRCTGLTTLTLPRHWGDDQCFQSHIEVILTHIDQSRVTLRWAD